MMDSSCYDDDHDDWLDSSPPSSPIPQGRNKYNHHITATMAKPKALPSPQSLPDEVILSAKRLSTPFAHANVVMHDERLKVLFQIYQEKEFVIKLANGSCDSPYRARPEIVVLKDFSSGIEFAAPWEKFPKYLRECRPHYQDPMTGYSVFQIQGSTPAAVWLWYQFMLNSDIRQDGRGWEEQVEMYPSLAKVTWYNALVAGLCLAYSVKDTDFQDALMKELVKTVGLDPFAHHGEDEDGNEDAGNNEANAGEKSNPVEVGDASEDEDAEEDADACNRVNAGEKSNPIEVGDASEDEGAEEDADAGENDC